MNTSQQARPVPADYSVHTLQAGDEDRWDAFVDGCENATFYHLSGWQKIIGSYLRHNCYYLYCERDGQIVSALPLAQVKSALFGNALISVPFLVYGGVIGADAEAEALLLTAASDLARELRVDYVELRSQSRQLDGWHSKGSHVTFVKSISSDSDENMKSIPRKQRAMIRKGIKAGLQVEIDSDVSRLYPMMLESKRNLGTPFFSAGFLQSICDVFGKQVEIITITHEGKSVCSVMSFRYRNQILPYYGGGGASARSLYGNDFMYWSVLDKACKDGVEIFDFGRSMKGSGAYNFKRHWGFEPTPLHYQYLPVMDESVPDLSPNNPRYRLLVNGWKKLPLSIARVIGPPLARRLG